MFHGSVLIGCWILHALGLLGAGPDSWGLLLSPVQGWVGPVLLAGLAAPGPAGGLSFLVGAGLLLAAGLALLGLEALSALLLGSSAAVGGAWALCLHTHSLAAQALPR